MQDDEARDWGERLTRDLRRIFTREDVDRLREVAAYLDTPEVAATDLSQFVAILADRIEGWIK